jgi:hypothetical protein
MAIDFKSIDFVATHRRVFIGFMVREGYTVAQASEEFTRLNSALTVPVGRLDFATLRPYLTLSRVGASFTLDRKGRISLASLFDNAGNHACAELELNYKNLSEKG